MGQQGYEKLSDRDFGCNFKVFGVAITAIVVESVAFVHNTENRDETIIAV